MNSGLFNARGWFAAHVRYQREQAVSALLAVKGIETYVPTFAVISQWADRKKQLDRPLFPGYVFCRMGAGEWFKIQSSAGVLRIIGVGKQPIEIDPHEMEAIHLMEAAGVPRKPCPYVTVGDLVEVKSGPMSGFTGILKELRNERTLIISIGLLKRSVAIDLHEDWATAAPEIKIQRPIEWNEPAMRVSARR